MSGMISSRHKGASIAELSGTYLGSAAKWIMRVFLSFAAVCFGVYLFMLIRKLRSTKTEAKAEE